MKAGTYALMTGWLSLAGGAVAAQEFQFLPAVAVNENAPGGDGPYTDGKDVAMAVEHPAILINSFIPAAVKFSVEALLPGLGPESNSPFINSHRQLRAP